MQLKYAAIALACLAEQICNVHAKGFLGAGLEGRTRRRTDMTVDYDRLYRRVAEPQQPSSTVGSVMSSPTATVSSTTPSTTAISEIIQACTNKLSELRGVSASLTGMSMCYDVSLLDMNTGSFMSTVFLYQVSPASGNWTVIDNNSLNVDIAYANANLTAMGVAKRELANLEKRLATNIPVNAPVLITSQQFMGEIMQGWNSNNEYALRHLFTPKSTNTVRTQQMIALAPTVIVTAKTPDGKPLSSALSKTEAAFVTGFFAKTAAAEAAAASAAAANVPFQLPGVTAAFFPVGAVVTGAWVLLFALTVGLGTLGRLQFRHDFRARAGRSDQQGAPQPTGPAAYDLR